MTTIQPYIDQGNFTQMHNANFDHIMPLLSGSAWKVLCLIIRKTKGWQKEEDDIAYSQLKAGTGIKSDATISKAIKELLELGVIQVGKATHQADPHAYRLNKFYSCRTSKNEDSTPKKWSTTTSKNEDTKESPKERLNTSAAVIAYENTFGTITYQASQKLNDDIDTYGEGAVIQALSKAKEKRANRYAYVEAILKGKADDDKQTKQHDDFWKIVEDYQQRRRKFADLPTNAQAAIRAIGGESVLRGAKVGFELDQIKRQVMTYAQ